MKKWIVRFARRAGCALLLAYGPAAWVPVHAAASVTAVYPAPPGVSGSALYSVSVGPAGAARSSFVYLVDNIGLAAFNWQGHAWNNSTELTTAWTSFDFGGPGDFEARRAPVSIEVRMAMPQPAYRTPGVRILPTSAGIAPGPVESVGQSYRVRFQIDHAGQYSVEFFDAAAPPDFATWVPQNPLLLFANPPESDAPVLTAPNVKVLHPGEPIPTAGDWGMQQGVRVDTLYFTPGVYDLGKVPSAVNPGIYVLHSHQSVYLEGGSYVKGAFVSCPTPARCTDAADIRVFGHGILSGENFQRPFNGASFESLAADLPALIQLQGNDISQGRFDGQRRARIEGLTLIQAPFDNIYLGGIDNTVENVKLISWYPSTDGIKAGYDYLIDGVEYAGHGRVRDSFLKDGDDSIHLYSSGLRVERVVIWQSKNAAPFQFGSGNPGNIDDVQVSNSAVIHTEWNWPNMANAVFDANLGGSGDKGYDRGYTFDHIEVENSGWQLFRLSIGPTIWQFGNTHLGTLSNLTFREIVGKEPQALPDIFRSYDRVHPIRNVVLDNVVVAGVVQAAPHISFDANRAMSLSGDIVTEPLWVNTGGTADPNARVYFMSQGMPTSSPITSTSTLEEGFLNNPGLRLLRRGDFFGDGYASPLLLDASTGTLSIWCEPLNPGSPAGQLGELAAAQIPTGYGVAGVGDFNGDGISDVLLWNEVEQRGVVLSLVGEQLATLEPISVPPSASTWQVAGIGDFNDDGISDILLRDEAGNLEILYLTSAGVGSVSVLTPAQLGFTATPSFQSEHPTLPAQGTFDASWRVIGVGRVNDYAAVLWMHPDGELGLTQFIYPDEKPYGNLVAVLPAGAAVRGLGDYNGDGSIDLMLRDAVSGELSFWYLGWFGGNYYQPAPAAGVSIPAGWQN